MRDYRTHYKAFFSIHPEEPAPDQAFWSRLIKTVGEWMFDKYADTTANKHNLIKTWLFLGGEWLPGIPEVTAETKVLRAGTALDQPPRYWTFRHTYRDHEFRAREWQVNIGITSVENRRFDVVVTYSHCVLPGHFGEEPPPPQPEVPGIVSYFFDLPHARICLNDRSLYAFPQPLLPGQAPSLAKMLTDPARKNLVLLAHLDGSSNLELDLPYLAQLLIANANIYYYDDDVFEDELRRHISGWYGTYYCPRNAIRIYQPGLNIQDPLDYKRHRYFHFHEYARINDLEDVIFKGLQRRRELPFMDFVAFREDIYHKEKAQRLLQLGGELRVTARDKAEYIEMLEAEVGLLQGEKDDWAAQTKKAEEALSFLEYEAEDLADQVRRLKFEQKQFEGMAASYEKREQQYRHQVEAMQQFAKLPGNLPEVVGLIAGFHEGRLLFLPEAKASAADSEYDDLGSSWSLLWHLATTLWELIFTAKADLTTLQNEFKARSGFEVSFTEGKHTKIAGRMMIQRMRLYKGREVDMLPHAKADKGGKHLRIHFFVDHADKLIVIGHCGDHLETYGTRRRKEQ